jgi:hypothetical protein
MLDLSCLLFRIQFFFFWKDVGILVLAATCITRALLAVTCT